MFHVKHRKDEIMDIQIVQNLISSVGFPIFVAVWMLYKSSKDSEAVADAIHELKNTITELSTLIKNSGDKSDE